MGSRSNVWFISKAIKTLRSLCSILTIPPRSTIGNIPAILLTTQWSLKLCCSKLVLIGISTRQISQRIWYVNCRKYSSHWRRLIGGHQGLDDQVYWAFSAMDAVEAGYPNPPSNQPQWLALAQAVFNFQAALWDTSKCGGGFHWQVYSFNVGYNLKNTISNGGFFQLAARLARYTGNSTYSSWADKVRNFGNEIVGWSNVDMHRHGIGWRAARCSRYPVIRMKSGTIQIRTRIAPYRSILIGLTTPQR